MFTNLKSHEQLVTHGDGRIMKWLLSVPDQRED